MTIIENGSTGQASQKLNLGPLDQSTGSQTSLVLVPPASFSKYFGRGHLKMSGPGQNRHVVDPAQSILTREHLNQCIILKQMKPLINSDIDANAI